MRSLRSRLILSHLLPVLVIAPLMALTLAGLLQTQNLLTELSVNLTQTAESLAARAQQQESVWQDPTAANDFLRVVTAEQIVTRQTTITLLEPDGDSLAETGPSQNDGLPNPLPTSGGQTLITYETQTFTVLVPVYDDNTLLGVVQVQTALEDASGYLPAIRLLLIAALVLELILALAVAFYMAVRLNSELEAVTTAVSQVTVGHPLPKLDEQKTITEFQSLIEAYNQMAARLENAETTRRHLLANVVHELGRPLGAMRAAVQALLQGADQDPALRHDLLVGIEAQIDRLRPVLDNLSGLYGQLQGEMVLNSRPIVLAPWLRQVAVMWQATAVQNGQTFEMNIAPHLETLTLTMDGDRMAQAVGNLLSNAVKYTPTDGTIWLTAEIQPSEATNPPELHLSVSDNGPGITAEEQEQIFTPFYRSRTDTRFPQGMGLGLAIAREIVVRHHGRVVLTSTRGEGSTFTIILPLDPTPA
ncbi:MAG: HAMP domain-containing histidine kinase [Anaerolineales bacterium]|nr:HAMP domain-containing histidine kinase [Anaerolineales bacterium]